MLQREVWSERFTSFVERLPVGYVGQSGNGDQLAVVQSGGGCVDDLLGRHDDLSGKIVDGQLGAVPERGAGGSGENGLYLDTLVLDLVVEGLGEIDHECFGAAVNSVEQLGAESGDRSDINDEPFGALEQAGQSRGGKSCQSGDVQLDHIVHVVDVRIDQLGYAAKACIIHQRGDSAVRTQALLDAFEVGLHGKVR